MPSIIDPETTPPRRAIFGGSFDPVHLGHLGMVTASQGALELDEVIFVPCHVSPFKSGTVATGAQRMELLELAIRDSGFSWASVSPIEIDREGSSYSWETASFFAAEDSASEWYWILGTDQWDSIERWANPEILKELLHFVVLTRDGQPVSEREGWRYTAVPFSHPASSTVIRAGVEEKRGWVTPGVLEYCLENKLYQEAEEI
tara:strand:+ start:5035 stop:5643 length:609 start_codon:yes stop_codon:yes gene_type:complete